MAPELEKTTNRELTPEERKEFKKMAALVRQELKDPESKGFLFFSKNRKGLNERSFGIFTPYELLMFQLQIAKLAAEILPLDQVPTFNAMISTFKLSIEEMEIVSIDLKKALFNFFDSLEPGKAHK